MAKAPKFLQGKLLLDGGELKGSFFHRTVILICQHDANGAFGLILNNPTQNKVGEVVTADLPQPVKGMPIFVGGPVQPSALSYVYANPFMPQPGIIDNLYLGHTLDGLRDMEFQMQSSQIRLFAGYAGWSAGQLEEEMKRDTWLVHPASLDLVFDEKPEELWQAVLRKKGWKYRLIAERPDDLSWN
ncbi:MAG: hypothetical protein JWM04_469 [Verrucomicrobiales bacterium]|nr:hypothetical protein [Verrucomicrobiales bacterium]